MIFHLLKIKKNIFFSLNRITRNNNSIKTNKSNSSYKNVLVTKPRLAGFVHFLVERTAGTPTVNPELEIKVLGPILAKLVARTVNRVWSKDEKYLKIVRDADYDSYKLSSALDMAVQKTLDEADAEPNLAKVTSLLVENIHSEDLRPRTQLNH